MLFAELLGNITKGSAIESYAVHTRQQEREGHSLRVSVCEILVIEIWKESVAPFTSQGHEHLILWGSPLV